MAENLLVDAPLITARRFGLLSVAQFPTSPDPHWPLGIQFEQHGNSVAFSADGWCRPAIPELSVAAGTAEQQTVTITGTPTGGTFTLSGGTTAVKGTTAPIAYNAAAATVQTAIRTLPGFDGATVAGSAGGPYTVTFPAALGNVDQLTAAASLTGGTTPGVTVATTVPGVTSGPQTSDQGISYGSSATVTISAVLDATIVGRDVEDARRIAKLKLDLAAERALEKAIWTGKDSATATITGQKFADATNTAILGGGTAQDMVTAVGLLEDWLGSNYAGIGVIHGQRAAGAPLDRWNLIGTNGGHKETGLGTLVALGAGYPGSGRDNAAAPAGQGWLVATPAVSVRQGPDEIVPDAEHDFDRISNRAIALAQRQYLVSWETGASIVLAKLGAA